MTVMVQSRDPDGLEMERKGQSKGRLKSTVNTLSSFAIFCARKEASVIIQ